MWNTLISSRQISHFTNKSSQVLHAHKKPELEHLLQSYLLSCHNVVPESFQQNRVSMSSISEIISSSPTAQHVAFLIAIRGSKRFSSPQWSNDCRKQLLSWQSYRWIPKPGTGTTTEGNRKYPCQGSDMSSCTLCTKLLMPQYTQHGRHTSQCHPKAPQSSQQTCHQDSCLGQCLCDPVKLMSPFRLTKETT